MFVGAECIINLAVSYIAVLYYSTEFWIGRWPQKTAGTEMFYVFGLLLNYIPIYLFGRCSFSMWSRIESQQLQEAFKGMAQATTVS